jgi:hypothetical protein
MREVVRLIAKNQNINVNRARALEHGALSAVVGLNA